MTTRIIADLAVELDGDSGTPLLMVHGLGGTSNTFTPLVAALRAQHRVIRPDLPGAGRSAAAPPGSLREMAVRLRTLLDALALPTVGLVGHSLGTMLCQYLAEAEPARVTGMVLLGPILEPAEAGRQALRERAALARREGMAGIADAVVAAALARETRETQPVTCALVRELLMRQPPEGYAQQCEALSTATRADLARLNCPVLLITGDQDGTSPVPASEAMAAQLADGRLEVLAPCGHWASLEQPASVATRVAAFFAAR